jgi:hypothetical protein
MISLGNTAFNDESGIGAEVRKNEPWTKKYEGHDLSGIILPTEIHNEIEFGIQNNSLTDYIFHSGAPGTGKTSLAKAIPEMLGVDSKFFKCTKDSEIMDSIEEYIMYSSPDGKPRFIIIDEADKPKDADRLFRFLQSTISEETRTVRFILTMNDFWRIPEAIVSRCHPIEFTVPSLEDRDYKNRLFKHLMTIAKKETEPFGGTVEKNTIVRLIKDYFPDIRQMIVCMQSIFNQNKGSIKGEPPRVSGEMISEIYRLTITYQVIELRRYISAYVKFPRSIYTPFCDFAVEHLPQNALMPFGILAADYIFKSANAVDQEINLWGFLLNVMKILQSLPKPEAK